MVCQVAGGIGILIGVIAQVGIKLREQNGKDQYHKPMQRNGNDILRLRGILPGDPKKSEADQKRQQGKQKQSKEESKAGVLFFDKSDF